jgi:ATP-dependent Zn protease
VANVNKEAHKTMMDDEAIKIAPKNDAADRVNDQELKNLVIEFKKNPRKYKKTRLNLSAPTLRSWSSC